LIVVDRTSNGFEIEIKALIESDGSVFTIGF